MTTFRLAARVLVDQLRIHGVHTVYGVPGESFLAVLDALYDEQQAGRMRVITARQEGGAAFMAEAHGKLSGQPGVCFVTRGPGACNASIGVHTAFQDATPMILFIGQVERRFLEREGFQEIDIRRMFGSISKWATQIDDARRIPEVIARAFQLAVSGRPGPVVIGLPEDVQLESVDVMDGLPYQRVQSNPGNDQLAQLRVMLAAAQRPLVIVGGGDWSASAGRDIQMFAGANGLPVIAAFRAQDVIDNRSPVYCGALGPVSLAWQQQCVREADLILCVGDRLSEASTMDYTLLSVPRPAQRLIHVHPSPDELGHVYQADLPITSGMSEFARAAAALQPVAHAHRAGWLRDARAAYQASLLPPPASGEVDLPAIYAWLRERLPADAIQANGAGNYALYLHRLQQFTCHRSQLAPVNGTMGYGVPAAVAAKLMYPERMVLAFAGDGCFLMNGQELATAAQYNAPIIVIVINNNRLGTIRTHQERHYPGRVMATDLKNPDFAALARAFGGHGEVVLRTDQFASAFERAVAAGTLALIEVRVVEAT